jgi:molybdopterin-guanine dinucleotide biosynthesis protein A
MGEVSGLVLAGGASVRMGQDKAVMMWDGQRLVDRAVGCLRLIADDVVVANGRRTLPDLDVAQIADQPPGVGPLGGIAAGLGQAEHDLVCVLAVDLPYADPDMFRALIERWQGEAAVIPTGAGQPQPLHAVWTAAAAPALGVLIADGVRSVGRAAAALDALVLDAQTTSELIDHDRWATNVNRPSDVDASHP